MSRIMDLAPVMRLEASCRSSDVAIPNERMELHEGVVGNASHVPTLQQSDVLVTSLVIPIQPSSARDL